MQCYNDILAKIIHILTTYTLSSGELIAYPAFSRPAFSINPLRCIGVIEHVKIANLLRLKSRDFVKY